MRRIFRFLVPVLMLLIAACAAREGGVRLAYAPVPAASGCAGKIAVPGFKDARATRALGKTDGVDLFALNTTPEEWVASALALEIAATGCEVDRVVQPGSPFPPDFTITGELTRLYLVRDFWSYSLEMGLNIEVRRGGPDGEYAFRKNYKGEWQKKTVGRGEGEAEILASALKELLGDEVMPDLLAVLR